MKPLQLSHMLANGDTAVLVYFKDHSQQNTLIQFLADYIRTQRIKGICDVVPALQSVLLVFQEPLKLKENIDAISAMISDACLQSLHHSHKPQLHPIKVCYDLRLAPDLEQVMTECGLSLEQLIEIHTADHYSLAMLGFLPGFAYLNGLDSRLTMPRKMQPQQNTAAGSIAIAGNQTGIYALMSPGGWHVIGRTPSSLINWQTDNPMLYKPLDQIKFEAISLAEFKELSP